MAKGLIILSWVFLIAMLFQENGIETEPSLICENYSIRRAKKGYAFFLFFNGAFINFPILLFSAKVLSKDVSEYLAKRELKAFAVLLFLLPFIFIAFRTEFVDTAAYYWNFTKIKTDISLNDAVATRDSDELFYALEFLFKKYISSDAQFFLWTVAAIESLLLISSLRRYSENLGMSVYIFVSSAMVFSWMCNGIRQFLVVTILFALTNLILKNKWYIYLPVVLVLSGVKPIFTTLHWGTPPWFLCGIHQSALLVIPIYFIVRGKALTKKVWLLLAALLIITALGLLDSILETSTENTVYASDLELINNSKGANPIRFFVSLVPIVLVVAKRKDVVSEETPAIMDLSVNMSFVASTLYLASVFTSGVFIGRLPIYAELYNLILFPWLINHIYAKDKKIVTPTLYVLYFIFFLYQIFVAWGNQIFTVKLFGYSF